MPELPEIEHAAGIARAVAVGKVIVSARALHPSQQRRFPDADAASLVGDRVVAVERRGKHQLLRLASERTLHVHFKMTGDWRESRTKAEPGRFTRVLFDFADGSRLELDDSRALGFVALVGVDVDPLPALGPEATAPAFDAEWLVARLGRRRGPIKPALLDQRLVAGIGNIYASEALWYAKVDPRRAVHRLNAAQHRAIVLGVKRALRKALEHPERYYGAVGPSDAVRFNVYDREGKACRRCGTPIVRISQAARSTYFCRACQR